jgi:adenosylmethionine-8-amino-7-oxononanoate aminotransferase
MPGSISWTACPAYRSGHPTRAFALPKRIADLAPVGLDRAFLVNRESEAYAAAMKIAIVHPLF